MKELLEAGVNGLLRTGLHPAIPFTPTGGGIRWRLMFLASHAAHMSRPHEIEDGLRHADRCRRPHHEGSTTMAQSPAASPTW